MKLKRNHRHAYVCSIGCMYNMCSLNAVMDFEVAGFGGVGMFSGGRGKRL